jgi:DNA-binding MarR family transcriptional regulator
MVARRASDRPVSFPSDESWRARNTSRLLYKAAWLFDQRILAIVNRSGFSDIRVAQLHLPRNLDIDGTRLTVLAKRAEMSKQAMGELVDQCEKMHLVERRSDPQDHRAKIVVFTPRGRRLIEAVRAAVEQAESEMAKKLGTKRAASLIAALAVYCSDAPPARG